MASCCLSDQTLACPGGRYVAISVARLCCCMVARRIRAFNIEQHNFVQVYVVFSDISIAKPEETSASRPSLSTQTGIEALHRKNFFPNCSSLVQFVRNNSDNSHFLEQSTTYLGMCTNFLRQDNFQSSSKHILIDLFTPQSSLGRAVWYVQNQFHPYTRSIHSLTVPFFPQLAIRYL